MAKSTNLSFLGIAKEITLGTPAAPTAFIPVKPPTVKDNLTLLEDKGLRGSMVDVYGQVAGKLSSEIDFDGDVYPDTVGWLLAGMLGDVTTTGASAPFTHAMSVQNGGTGQPKSYTLTDYYVAGTRAYAGGKFSELGLKFSADAMLTYSAKVMAFGSATATKPTGSFTALPPLASWIGAVSIGGTPLTTVIDGEVNIKRSVTPVQTVSGTQAPIDMWSGPLTVDGKLTVVMDADTQLTNYLTAATPALLINFASGAGASATQVQLQMSSCTYSAAEISRGSDFVELDITFSANANATDIGASGGFSPILATIKNAVATGIYV
jgi:hypothetical protein